MLYHERNVNNWNIVLFYICLAMATQMINGIGNDVLQEIKTFGDEGLGISKIQEHIRKLEPKYEVIDENTAKKLANGINDRLKSFLTNLPEVKKKLEEQYTLQQMVPVTSHSRCKDISSEHTNLVLGDNFDMTKCCITGDILNIEPSNVKKFLSSTSLVNMWKNHYDKGIKYIKYGDEQGVLYKYPAKKFDQSYDNRFSSWYVETATASLKDVVVIIDRSQSMEQQFALRIAKEISSTIIDTLNSNDRISVIAFDENIITAGDTLIFGKSCYQKVLAKATDVNKYNLKKFVSDISVSRSRSSSFKTALQAGFRMFSDTGSDLYGIQSRKKVIIFITDGDTDEQPTTIYSTFKTETEKLNDTVSISTFGVGTNVKNEQMLKNLSEQTFNTGSDVPRASYTHVPDTGNAKAKASYFLTTDAGSKIKISVPYKDIFGSGWQISMCQSVYHGHMLKGVLCFDIAIEYLLSDVTYFRDDDGSYAFIVDSQSRVLSHPFLPNIAQLSEDSFFVYLQTVEIAEHIEHIRSSILRREEGSKKTTKLNMLPRGSGGGQDIITKKGVDVTYYWHPVKDTQFTVCLVATRNRRLTFQSSPPFSPLWYHTDHKKKEHHQKLCKSFTRIAAKGIMAVQLTTACYADPYSFTFLETPSVEITANFLRNSGATNPDIKNGIRETVAALHELENIWKDAGYSDFIVWRYYATGTGIMVITPALELPRTYDARVRGWFLGATADKSKYYITTPYKDLWGAGIVISLTKASLTTDGYTAGVISMDLTIGSFYYTITRSIIQCQTQTCIVINDAGFIIVHKNWFEANNLEKKEHDVHLVQEEKNIAKNLIDKNILKPKACIDMAEDFKERKYWQVSLEHQKTLAREDQNFQIISIPETNLFLIIKEKDSGILPDCDDCRGNECPNEKQCHCPCVKDSDSYEYCTATLNTSLDLPCAPKLPSLDATEMLNAEIETLKTLGLQECVDYKCETRLKERDCSGVLSCTWCTAAKNGQTLGTDCEYCTSVDKCPSGTEKQEVTRECDTPTKVHVTEPWLKKWEFAVIFIFMLITFGGILFLVIWFTKLRNCDNNNTECNTIKLSSDTRVQPDNDYAESYIHLPPYVNTTGTETNHAFKTESPEEDQFQRDSPQDDDTSSMEGNVPSVIMGVKLDHQYDTVGYATPCQIPNVQATPSMRSCNPPATPRQNAPVPPMMSHDFGKDKGPISAPSDSVLVLHPPEFDDQVEL